MIAKIAAAVGICLGVGAIAGIATARAIPTWYAGLQKPSFNPPDWLFGPVWTVLYILMGIALYLIWQRGHSYTSPAAIAFYIQLALNFAWSYLFFVFKSPLAGLVDIVLLWATIVATVVLAWPLSKLAAGLLVPYLAWVSFATALNYAILRLN